jgi:hypothetical protein
MAERVKDCAVVQDHIESPAGIAAWLVSDGQHEHRRTGPRGRLRPSKTRSRMEGAEAAQVSEPERERTT